MSTGANEAKLAPVPDGRPLSATGRYLVLITAFVGWLCAGLLMSISTLAMRPAAIDLLAQTGTLNLAEFTALSKQAKKQEPGRAKAAELGANEPEQLVARWFAWYQCAFLFGAVAGGLVFGRLGDRIGRSKGMAASILCYSALSGAAYFARSPLELWAVWFLVGMGVGGMWPNGVALVSEAWSNLSRPMVAGLMGTSANVGIFLLATLANRWAITVDHWRWVLLIGAAPVVLGLFCVVAVPESPRWLAARAIATAAAKETAPVSEVFRSPFLRVTLVGIVLATIPLIGGWGAANWMVPWADKAGERADPPDPYLKAQVHQARSLTGIVGSLLGGWIASAFGRRRSYFLASLAALALAEYCFWFTVPTDQFFLVWVAALGFVSGFYFGWLPLFLPELFPTRVRSTGAGVSFNFGRIFTVATIFATGALQQFFEGDYARIGRVTSLAYALGILAIALAPDTSKKQLED